jgi:hypothetical protein
MSVEATVRLMRSTPRARLRFALTVTALLSVAGEGCDKKHDHRDFDGSATLNRGRLEASEMAATKFSCSQVRCVPHSRCQG